MKPAEKFVRGWGFTVALTFLLILFASCKYELVKEPTHNFNDKKNAADYKDYILPPAVVSASHGLSHIVELEWEEVKNAVQYYIYSAATPYDVFQKVSETKANETQITIDEEAGITKYYCVCAVNYYGTVSSKSMVVMGSSLAVPVITSIESSEEGDSVIVNWWMDNCSATTYEKSVAFNVYAYAVSAPSIKLKSIPFEGHCRQAVVDGLASKTEYYFEVEVVNSENDSKETSGKTTAETAHRVVPDSPLEFSVSQGDSSDGVDITWKLPEKAWYRENAGVSGFVLHRLYFTVYRKLYGHSDNEYTAVETRHIPDTLAEPYISGAKISYTDTTAERGKKYTYYVQSFTDDLPQGKIITSDSSKTAQVDGWRLAVPQFSIKSEYTKSPAATEFIQIKFGFNLSLETYGKSYTYIVKRTQYDINNSTQIVNTEQPDWNFSLDSDLNNAKDDFNSPENQQGYYVYTLYICPFGSKDTDSALASVTASGKYIVTYDVNAIPTINNFILKDGFSNHFELSWEYNSKYRYIIHWTDVVNGIQQTPQSEEIPESWFEGKTDGATVVYNHTANSGDTRIYMLEASLGLSESFRPNSDTADVQYQTLGTAAPVIDSYEYDKICVSWPAVQKAGDVESYEVSAQYEDENNELVDGNISIQKQGSEEAPVYKCIITKPAGYDDPEKSGKNIKLKVTAKSADTLITEDNETQAIIDVCTVGPALTGLSVGEQKDNRIEISWKPVKGAKGYLIRRIAYTTADQNPQSIVSGECIEYPDIYYCEGTTISKDGESISPDICQVSFSNGKYTLTDKNSNSAAGNQNKIIWGIPFGYSVIPVKQGGEWQDFQPNGKTFSFGNNYESTYNQAEGTVPEVYNATKGYGLALHAKKSESGDTQEIVWNEPYNSQSVSPVYYYRDSESTSNTWHKIDEDSVTLSQDSEGKWHALFAPDSRTSAYEYFVAYNMNSSELVDRVSTSFMNDTVVGLSAIDGDYNFGSFPQEKANKGYLLYVPKNSYTAATGDDFDEIASWSAWDHSYRSIGPSAAYICIKNYNISTEWNRVAELDSSLYFARDPNGDQDNTTVSLPDENNRTRIKIRPIQFMDGTLTNPITKGPLQVLRDAKHYYALSLENEKTSVFINNDDKVYAYRDITQKELIKCALLTMAYGFYLDGGGEENLSNVSNHFKYGNNKTINGRNGYAYFSKGTYHANGKYDANITMNAFAPLQKNPANQYTSLVQVSMSNVGIKIQGTADYYLFKFDSSDFLVSVRPDNLSDEKPLPSSYSADFKMTCTGYNNLKIEIDNEPIVSTNDKEIRKVYFPLQIHNDDQHYWITNSTYGWWPQ